MSKPRCFSNCNLLFFKLTFFLNLKLYFSLPDNHFGDCITKKCGDLNISYPFYINNQQKSYCGFPGFEVFCKDDNFPYLNISKGVTYVIKNISYQEQTFQVVNSLLLESFGDKKACSGVLQHLNLTFSSDVFKYTAADADIILFLNCPEKILQQFSPNSVVCGAVAVHENDAEVGELEGKCNGVVRVPYEGERANVGNVKAMLEEGFTLNWVANNCSTCKDSGGQCGYDQTITEFGCFCSDRTHAYHCVPDPIPVKKKKQDQLPLIMGLGGSTIAIVTLIGLVICAKRTTGEFTVPWSKGAKGNQNVEAFLKAYGCLAPKRYTYAEIRQMTNSFKHKLGEGGYGTVYKGKLQDGRLVAVKKLKKVKGNGEDFINEVVSISRTNHVNVVALLGFCSQGSKRALVYEFMPNGSLEKFINRAGSGQPLGQETMFDIAVGVAKGLDYLHRGCNARILHFDIKPHNILLDQEFCAKISDFGLAKLSVTKNSTVSMLEARGTIGYIAPEVFCRSFGGVSHKSDVYSYGMMVIDMACGRKNLLSRVQNSSEQYFPDWIYDQLELEDEVGVHGITNDVETEIQRKMVLVGLWCIQTYPSNRPSMNRVVEMLEGRVESIQMPPKPHLYSPPQSVIVSSGAASLVRDGLSLIY